MKERLRSKIIELFEYRQLPELIKFGGNPLREDFYEKLIDLQYHIYRLDHELESNWNVDPALIDNRWKSIYQALDALGIPSSDHDNYCRHIYKYQKHELDIRALKLPIRLSMEYFYFYKSCDVKLLRKIIYKNNPKLSKAIKESHWRLFDLVTEINDDVEDLQEDVTTINGNRFLISLKLLGKKKTTQIFSAYLQELRIRNNAKPLTFEGIDLSRWTEIQIEETLTLLHKQVDLFSDLDTTLYDRLVQSNIQV